MSRHVAFLDKLYEELNEAYKREEQALNSKQYTTIDSDSTDVPDKVHALTLIHVKSIQEIIEKYIQINLK